jgi:hypothetical protein
MRSIDEESSPLSRLYEAKCPKVGAPLTEAIELKLGETKGGQWGQEEGERNREICV